MCYFVKPTYLARGSQEGSVRQFFYPRAVKKGTSLLLKPFAT